MNDASSADATTCTEHEVQEVAEANATGKQPVVFVHGLWLLPSSWDRWREVFEDAGYVALAPGCPGSIAIRSAPAEQPRRAHRGAEALISEERLSSRGSPRHHPRSKV